MHRYFNGALRFIAMSVIMQEPWKQVISMAQLGQGIFSGFHNWGWNIIIIISGDEARSRTNVPYAVRRGGGRPPVPAPSVSRKTFVDNIQVV